jgi:hypothetical protein
MARDLQMVLDSSRVTRGQGPLRPQRQPSSMPFPFFRSGVEVAHPG